jgi:hypothetical protein
MPRLSKIGAAALAAFGWTGLSSVSASYLVVAGGSGGGVGSGGGGGAGGYQSGTTSLNPTLSYTITVGAGGASGTSSSGGGNGDGGSGSDSIFSTITSTAGGYGAGGQLSARNGGNGGSGGGGADTPSSGGTGNTPSTSPSQGSNGGAGSSGNGGGGGGASAVGTNASGGSGGNGGAGTASSISGSSVTYAGGGGGAGSSSGGTGGSGGGGVGGTGTGSAGNGTANLGGGGGGTRGSTVSGSGGSGIVIISYVGAQQFGGGVVTSSGGNTIHTFTTSGTLSPLSSLTASALVVAGGGAGGGDRGGGGGAGGFRTGSGITIDTNSIYTVTVGAGGAGVVTSTGNSGSDSTFFSITSAGGGGGGAGGNGVAGGSGGGGWGSSGSGPFTGGAGNTPSTSPSQGNNGGTGEDGNDRVGGGGGGASAVGTNGTSNGAGGAGTASSISGTSVTYAGGGGGGGLNAPVGTGGAGGGGAGVTSGSGNAGTANTGGGGGGAGDSGGGRSGGSGGSGVVIISYPGSTQLMAGGTVTVAGGNVIHTFTSSGYLTPIVLVNNSLRFRSSASAYLNRTPASAGNRKTWTWSAWIKRGALTGDNYLFAAGTSNSDRLGIAFPESLGIVGTNGGSNVLILTSTPVYRDPSAWYHIVIAIDTTQATASNRAKIYVNGVQVTAFGTATYPSQNTDLQVNSTNPHVLGTRGTYSVADNFDGYMADINFIDGQALTPNSFGTSNGLGVWQPIRYGGSYGTNGFYLPFTNSGSVSTNYLVVAGGGGAGESFGAGGGGGGVVSGTTTLNQGSSYTVTVGAGGANQVNTTGGNSSFTGLTTAIGGGCGGGSSFPTGTAGGSGGGGRGGASPANGGAGTAGQGNAGGNGTSVAGGGGGGAGGAGVTSGNTQGGAGGAGIANPITGSTAGQLVSGTYYLAGGGSGNGTGGGQTPGNGGTAVGTAGAANTGAGAGGDNPVFGGSGIVIVSYAGTPKFTGGIVSQTGGNTIHTFTSSGTLNGIGSDYSPNGNNWTANNFSFSSGTTYDSMTDVPTLTSATAANYAVWNPLWSLGGSGYITPTNGNLRASIGGSYNIIASTISLPSTGKWYMEFTLTTGVYAEYGLCSATASGGGTNAGVFAAYYNGVAQYALINGSATLTDGNQAWVSGDIGLIAVDVDNNKVWLGRNRSGTVVWMGGGNPSAGTSPSFSAAGGGGVYSTAFNAQTFNNPFVASGGGSDVWDANFGQQPFVGTPPTDFLRLNTFNLPTPTIPAGNLFMNATLYTGNGSAATDVQTITNGVAGQSFQPDLVWTKSRSNAVSHHIGDSVRGIDKTLFSNLTAAEASYTYDIHAFNSNGFTVGNDGTQNTSGYTYVAWQWRASNATAVTNTQGSINSSVSANTTAGFSIVTYTGNATAGATIGHGLGVAPAMIIVKRRDDVVGWFVWHTAFNSATAKLDLNSTDAIFSSNVYLNSTFPSSTVVTLGTSGYTNASGGTYVMYAFAQVAGYSAFGSYTGNGSSDGPFVFTGFRPRFVLIRRTDSGPVNWFIWDTSRDTYNVAFRELYPDQPNAESTSTNSLDILSNGIKLRTSSSDRNANGGNYIYMVFAENPFKYANAR